MMRNLLVSLLGLESADRSHFSPHHGETSRCVTTVEMISRGSRFYLRVWTLYVENQISIGGRIMAKRLTVTVMMLALLAGAVALAQQINTSGKTTLGATRIEKARPEVVNAAGVLVIPWHVNYQGYLTDDAGVPVNDTLDMTFGIWDASVSGTELWSEDQTLPVEDGLFNVVLGSITPIPQTVFQSGQTRWLELTVELQTLSPRTEITSVSYAYRAVNSDSADNASQSDMVDGFHASATPGASDLFPLSQGDAQYVNENQANAITSAMIADGEVLAGDIGDGEVNSAKILDSTIVRVDVDPTFKAPYSDTADYAHSAPASPDNDWTIAGNVIHPSGQYGLSLRGSNILHGIHDSTHVNLGVACTTGTSGIDWRYCTVSGGWLNSASAANTTVGGGWDNRASDDGATVAGGSSNRASGVLATVGGGQNNLADENRATVCGGAQNRAGGLYAAVAGGWQNSATGDVSTVGGGWMNSAAGNYSAVPGGGYADTAAGDYSVALGYRVRVDSAATNTFAFGRDFTTSTSDAVIFHNSTTSIHVGIQNTAPTHLLDVGGSGAHCDGGAWIDGSSREKKENIAELTLVDALAALERLMPVTYNYKFDNEGRVGFIAEDLPDLVAMSDRKGISATEIVAVLTRVVKDQQNVLERQQEEIESLRQELEVLKN